MKGYRTILANGVLLAMSVGDYLVNNGGVVSSLVEDPKSAARTIAVITIVNIALRSVTTGPVGKKDKPE